MNRIPENVPRILVRSLAGLLLSMVTTMAFAGTGAPITLEDLLHAEGIGHAQFAPGSSGAYAFERHVSTAAQDTWGYDDPNLVRSRVFVVARAGAQPKEIRNTSDVRYMLVPWKKIWSPDGRELLLVATTRKGYGLAIYDLASEKVTRLPGRIEYSYPTFDWTSDNRLLYYAIPEDAAQRMAYNQVLANVQAHWNGNWFGDQPQVTVSSASPVFKTSEPPSGYLMLSDPRNGTTDKLATGDFYTIVAAPDHRHVAVVRAAEQLSPAVNLFGRRGELEIFSLDSSGQGTLQHRYPDLDISSIGIASASLVWSPTGDRLLVMGAPAGKGPSGTNLYVVDITSGQIDGVKAPARLSFTDPTSGGLGTALPFGWVGNRPVAAVSYKAKAGAPAAHDAPQATTHLDYGDAAQVRFDIFAFGAEQPPQALTTFAKASVRRFLVPAGGEGLLAIADGAVWKLAPGQQPVQLTKPGSPRILDFATAGAYAVPETAYFHDGAHERLGLTALVDGKPKRVVLDLRSGQRTTLKARGRVIATASNQLETLSKLNQGWTSSLLLNGSKGTESTILTINEALRHKAVAKPEPFKFTYQGKSLTGWVVLPPDAIPGVPLPAVVSVYGGEVFGASPPSAAKPGFSIAVLSGQLLATQGYAVIFPSTPLGEGATTNIMQTLAGETVAASEALAAKGMIDPTRVGVMGQSFGGYSTAAILAERSDFFRAGVSLAGIYGWIGAYGMVPMTYMFRDDGDIFDPEMKMVEDGQSRLGKPFWKAPDAYMRNSPIFRVEDIKSPLLMLHGDLDLGVTGLPLAIRMYNALLRAGQQDVALVRYWGEFHAAMSAPAIRDQWSRITGWFDYYVKNAPHGKK